MTEKLINVRLPMEQINRIDAEMKVKDNRSAMIRELIDRGLDARNTDAEFRKLRDEIQGLQEKLDNVAAVSDKAASQLAQTRAEVADLHACLPRSRDNALLQLMPRANPITIEARVAGVLPITGQIVPNTHTWKSQVPPERKSGHD